MIAARRTIASPVRAPRGSVTLDYEARHLRRRVLALDSGEDLLVDLPEAVELRDGEALVLDDGGEVLVRAAAEPLTEARAPVALLARLAWHIGNRHVPCQIEETRLLIQRDPVLEDMLRRLGAEVTSVTAVFQPEAGAYGHGRTHRHAEAGDAQTDPNAGIPRRYG